MRLAAWCSLPGLSQAGRSSEWPEPGLGIAIGVANPLGIIMMVTAIVALALARGDAKGRAHVVEGEE